MAAGFMTSRILLLCLLNEVTYASGLRAANPGYEAWQDGGQKREHGYRRPLQYIRSLRQPKNNPEHLNQFHKWQNSQRSLMKDLSRGQALKQTMSHLWPQMSPVQPAPQRNYPMVHPRGFKVSLDIPFFEKSQSKVNDSAARGYDQGDTKPKTKLMVQFQSGFSIPEFQSPESDSKKDPYVGKNIHSVSTPSLATPLATSTKPLKLIGGHAENLKDPVNNFQTSYLKPGKMSSSIQTGLKWPFSQTAGEHIKKQLGSTWSNYADTGPKETLQRPYQSIYTQPTDDKLTISTWQLNQHKTPKQISQEPPLAQQSLRLQRPDSTKPLSLPMVKYLEHLDFKVKTSPTRKDSSDQIVEPYSTQKQYLSPLQSNGRSQSQEYVGVGSPSVVQTQSSSRTSGVDIGKDLTKIQNGENDQDAGIPSLQLGFSFPLKTLLPNLTKSDGGYLNIRPESVGSLFTHYMESTKSNSPPTELKLSVLGVDDVGYERTNGHPERKWPILNLDMGHQQKKHPPYVPVPSKPADSKSNFPSWSPSQQAGQDETTSIHSWGPQKPKMGKPQFPVLAISKYLDLVDMTRPLKNDNSRTTQPKPSQSERVQSLYSLLKPITSYVQGQTRPSVSRLSSSTHDIGQFKPASDLQQNVEKTYSSSDHPPLTTHALSPFNSPKLEAGLAKKPQTWQKPVSSPYSHQYNSGREASYDTTSQNVPDLYSMPSGYQTQNKLLEQDIYGPNQDGNGKYATPFDTDGSGTVFGQTYQSKWTGKNTAGSPFNVQPPCESSSSRLGHQGYFADLRYPYLNAETEPCSPMPCMDRAGKCLNEPQKQDVNFPQQVNYSPKAEATSVYVPSSTFKPFFSQSSYQPDQYSYNLQQYSVGQGHPQQPTRFK